MQIEEDECDQWFPLTLEQGNDDEEKEIGILERCELHHFPFFSCLVACTARTYVRDQRSPHACGRIPGAPPHHGGGLSGPLVHCCGGISGAYERRQRPPVSCRGIYGAYRGLGPNYVSSAYEWHTGLSIPSG